MPPLMPVRRRLPHITPHPRPCHDLCGIQPVLQGIFVRVILNRNIDLRAEPSRLVVFDDEILAELAPRLHTNHAVDLQSLVEGSVV